LFASSLEAAQGVMLAGRLFEPFDFSAEANPQRGFGRLTLRWRVCVRARRRFLLAKCPASLYFSGVRATSLDARRPVPRQPRREDVSNRLATKHLCQQ
jgi:hypothetical protein